MSTGFWTLLTYANEPTPETSSHTSWGLVFGWNIYFGGPSTFLAGVWMSRDTHNKLIFCPVLWPARISLSKSVAFFKLSCSQYWSVVFWSLSTGRVFLFLLKEPTCKHNAKLNHAIISLAFHMEISCQPCHSPAILIVARPIPKRPRGDDGFHLNKLRRLWSFATRGVIVKPCEKPLITR